MLLHSRVYSAHSTMEQIGPGAKTDAQTEPSCHAAWLEARDEENTHAQGNISGRQNDQLHFYLSCDHWIY